MPDEQVDEKLPYLRLPPGLGDGATDFFHPIATDQYAALPEI